MTNPQRIQERLAQNSWGLLGNQGHVLGIDLGGYGLRVALVQLQNHTYLSTHADIQRQDPRDILDDSLALARRLLAESGAAPNHLVRVGVGIGAPVDPHRGTVLRSVRMEGWENFSLKDYFEQAFDAVTLVDNDANLIALSEATFGVGCGCQHLFYLHLSSGVGGGMVLDGRLYHGANGIAGEIGHAVVEPGTGSSSLLMTLEERASISGLLRRAGELGLETTNLNDIFGHHPVARQVVQEVTTLLAMRIAHVVALLDPQMVVLGGIVVRIGGEAFVQAIADQVSAYIAPPLNRPVQVVPAALSTDSIAIGALALALESLCD
ncbi:MAG: ROK family protein [Chloroflexaceae bacterium]|nr:ROK family protein [Chloroflexaceae bacterium]